MMTLANANSLFQGIFSPPNFNTKIYIKRGDVEDVLLRAARAKVRRVLRSAFSDFERFRRDNQFRSLLLEDRDDEMRKSARNVQKLDVRFLTQGSFAYRTLIRPASRDEEIDIDDGVYVPMPFRNGRPLFSSNGLFALIETALKPIADVEDWTFVRKDTCIRICLTGRGAHIDLPLYAVDESDFTLLSERFRNIHDKGFREVANVEALLHDAAGRRNFRLPSQSLMLADRELDWRYSDPKGLQDWFEGEVDKLGEALRRVCRYGKAWRDHSIGECSLSSLAIMVLSAEALNELGDQPSDNRDDELVLEMARALPNKIRRGGIIWREGEEPLDKNWEPVDRENLAVAAEEFATCLDRALNRTTHKQIVVDHLRESFGQRFPNSPAAVKIGAASQTAAVLSTPPSNRPAPDVDISTSG